MITDLTEGNISKKLWLFSVPMLISVIFQQLYNVADSMIAGKFIGEDALAAVGSSYPITMIFMAVAIGSNVGFSVVISQLFGGKHYRDMKTAISTTFIACGVLSVALTILGLAFSDLLMRMINTPSNIYKDAALYLNIYIGGLTFLFLYNICTGMFNALGDSRTPLYFLIGSSLGNIFLDWFFVVIFDLGIAGIAWATFLCQGISGILCFLTLIIRLKRVNLKSDAPIFSMEMLSRISRIAIPSIIQQSIISVGNFLLQRLINGYGSAVIAGYSAAVKLNTFAITSFTTFANGISTFTAQNIGAKKLDRVRKGFRAGCIMGILVALPFFLVYFFFDETILKLFLNSDSQLAMNTGKDFIKIVAPGYYLLAIKLMGDGILRGSGTMSWFMVVTFTGLAFRILFAYLLEAIFGITGIWIAWPTGWGISMILSLTFYFKGVWKRNL
ncbi:MAG: MATE family efflux transporter [Clostridiales bacterium]|nr:MATE family efflux transporter [Clostridiales bacterium]